MTDDREVVLRPRTISVARPVAATPVPVAPAAPLPDARAVEPAIGGTEPSSAVEPMTAEVDLVDLDRFDDLEHAADDDTGTPEDAGSGGEARRMARANVSVATGTLLSRITGLARTVLMFATLAPTLRDAYVLANNTPNIIYELILGGVLTATLVPLFTEFVTTDDDEATSAVVSAAITALVALTLLALVASPGLMMLYASNTPKGVSRGEFLSIGIRLALLFAPQVFFYGLMAVGSALLNSRRRFFAAAWTPVLNNVIVIAILIAVGHLGTRPALDTMRDRPSLLLLLGLGTTAGIVAMAVGLFPALRRAGVPLHFTLKMRHPAVKRAMILSGWTIGYVIANQISGQIVNVLTVPGSGGTANYQLSYQFFQLPHGLLAVSLMTTFQPELARAFALGDERAFDERLLQALRLLMVVVLPAAVLYLATPLATLVPAARIDADVSLVELGARSLRLGDAAEIGRILGAFAAGLLGFSLYLFVLRAFYARGDTKTPFFLNCAENVVNIGAAFLLVGRYGVVGLAFAYGLAYTVAAILSTVVLVRRLHDFDVAGLIGSVARIGLAGAAMAAATIGVGRAIGAASGPALLGAMALAGAVGLVAYVVALVALRVPGLEALAARLPGRRGRGASTVDAA